MKSKTKLKTTLLTTNGILGASAIGLGATIIASHNDENLNKTFSVYTHMLESQKFASDNSSILKLDESFNDKFVQAQKAWNSDNTLTDKMHQIEEYENSLAEHVLNNLSEFSFSSKEAEEQFWTSYILNQVARIREQDLNNQFHQIPNLELKTFAQKLSNLDSESKKSELMNFNQKLNEKLVEQNEILKSYLAEYEKLHEFEKSINLGGIKKPLKNAVDSLKNSLISQPFRFNDLDIAAKTANQLKNNLLSEVKKLVAIYQDLEKNLEKIKAFANSEVANAQIKQAAQSFLDKTNQDLELINNEQELRNLVTSSQTFYEQINDASKSKSEILASISALNPYLDKFEPELENIKTQLGQELLSASSKDTKDGLIVAKGNLFNNYYLAENINTLVADFKREIANGLQNKYVTEAENKQFVNKLNEILNSSKAINKKLNLTYALYNKIVSEIKARKSAHEQLVALKERMIVIANDSLTDEEIKTQLSDLQKSISNSYLVKNIESTYLEGVKNAADESYRSILKNDLTKLMEIADKYGAKLKQNPKDTQIVFAKIYELNKATSILVKPFNPATSSELEEQIKLYKAIFTNANDILDVVLAKNKAQITDRFLDSAFAHPNGEDFTKNEQDRINKYDELTAKLKELQNKVNEGDSNPEINQQINSIKNQLQNMSDTAPATKDLSDASVLGQAIADELANSKNGPALASYLDDIAKAQAQINALFNDTNATHE
ncbi:hypothetical protein [Mycoplasma buteonis]|uniref:hypothetical protein n=1 Tax=Mycoplasma buteonis TaxID=171280 RepID=UPI000567F41D|nr:hypothetical protein [Mycoplasma buteonis]